MGGETAIHPIHLELMKVAQLIVIRTPNDIEKIKQINPNVVYFPDIVYALSFPKEEKISKSVLILNNLTVLPTWEEPYWKHISWNYFKCKWHNF